MFFIYVKVFANTVLYSIKIIVIKNLNTNKSVLNYVFHVTNSNCKSLVTEN